MSGVLIAREAEGCAGEGGRVCVCFAVSLGSSGSQG